MGLSAGLHCRACDRPLTLGIDDPELCIECMAVVYQYNRKLIDEADDAAEVFDIDLLTTDYMEEE